MDSLYLKNIVNISTLYIKSTLRLKVWLLFVIIYLIFIVVIYFLKIPLKSQVSSKLNLLKGQPLIRNDGHAYLPETNKNLLELPFQKKSVNKDSTSILTDTFKKVDENGDGYVDTIELVAWIARRVREHLTQALRDNIFIFTAIDIDPRNGVISWDEYFHHFLKHRGYDETFIRDHRTTMKGMDRETKEAIMKEKAAWSQAVRDDPTRLSLDEFLAFRHPESSHASIISMVEETLARLDGNEDGVLTESEFVDVGMNVIPDHMTADEFVKKKTTEFRKVVDKDGNGKAERSELISYFNPRNVHHAEREAMDLISFADLNGDRKLSLPEILMQKEFFMRSKMVDVSISFHDEF